MKKLTRSLGLVMTVGLLFAACDNSGDIEDPPIEEDLNDGFEEDMTEDDGSSSDLNEDSENVNTN